jgi:hypothetical protein
LSSQKNHSKSTLGINPESTLFILRSAKVNYHFRLFFPAAV